MQIGTYETSDCIGDPDLSSSFECIVDERCICDMCRFDNVLPGIQNYM